MILTYIHLNKSTYLFRTLKKRGFLEHWNDALYIELVHKPNIGELLDIGTQSNHRAKKFRQYLLNRNKAIILRIDDLMSSSIITTDYKSTVINLKAHEDKF